MNFLKKSSPFFASLAECFLTFVLPEGTKHLLTLIQLVK